MEADKIVGTMDFIANIMPGTKGASGARPNSASQPGKSGGDERSPFGSLVSGGDSGNLSQKPSKTSNAGNDSSDKQAPAPEGVDVIAALETLEGKMNPGPSGIQGEIGELKPELRSVGDRGAEAALMPVDGNTLMVSQSQGLMEDRILMAGALTKGQRGGSVASLSISGLNLAGGSGQNGLPGGILGASQLEVTVPGGGAASKSRGAKPVPGKAGLGGGVDTALKGKFDMEAANSALAAFTKMNAASAGKGLPDFLTAGSGEVDLTKPAETRVSGLNLDNSLMTSADKPQGFHALLQSQQSNARPGTLPVNAVAVEIARRFSAGTNRFQIRLDPPELGRIDVRMDVNREGKVSAHLIVEKPETLAALNRDAGNLQRALNTSGLETSENGLNFSLSGGNHSFDGDAGSAGFGGSPEADIAISQDVEPLDAARIIRGYVSPGGVDIHV